MTKTIKKQKSSFGDWLKETRTSKGIGVRELASLVEGECSASYISYLERNVYEGKDGSPTRPSEAIVQVLAIGLDVPENEARIAAGYAPEPSSSSTGKLFNAFPTLFEGYGLLSEQGQEMARKQVESLIQGLMDMEGVSFADSNVELPEEPYGPGLDAEEYTIDLSRPQHRDPGEEKEEFSFMTNEELKTPKFTGVKRRRDKDRS